MQLENANKEILNAFKLYDVNKTGFITVKELKSILTMTGERLSNKDSLFHIFIRVFCMNFS